MTHTPEWKKLSGTASILCERAVGEYPKMTRCGKHGSHTNGFRTYCTEHYREQILKESAPDLLEALEFALSHRKITHHGDDVVIAKLSKAIAKAKGE